MIESISKNEISLRLDKGRALLESEAPDVALLVVWSALEAAMRLAVDVHSQEAARLSPAILSSYLFSRAFLSHEDYEFILSCSQQRNAVAHGFRQRVSKDDVERLRLAAIRILQKEGNVANQAHDQTALEIIGGESYEYTPLGQYIVRAAGVCGGRPTFKYTRIEVAGILLRLTNGETFQDVLADYEKRITREALQEAIEVNVARGILEELGNANDLAGSL